MNKNDVREKILNYMAYSQCFIGTKYKWGGESADEGFDCSGFVQEALSSVGLDPRGDQTAQALRDVLSAKKDWETKHIEKSEYKDLVKSLKYGDILFYTGSSPRIIHVAFYLGSERIIEAGGEGSRPTTKGMVRVRHLSYRSRHLAWWSRYVGSVEQTP